MHRLSALAAAVALVPAMAGPSRAAEGAVLVLALCNGGTIQVQAGTGHGNGNDEGPPVGACCAKACHGGDRRKPVDRKQ